MRVNRLWPRALVQQEPTRGDMRAFGIGRKVNSAPTSRISRSAGRARRPSGAGHPTPGRRRNRTSSPPRSARGGGHTCWSASLSVGPPAADAALVSQALHPAPPWPRLCPVLPPPGPPMWSSHGLPTCTQAQADSPADSLIHVADALDVAGHLRPGREHIPAHHRLADQTVLRGELGGVGFGVLR